MKRRKTYNKYSPLNEKRRAQNTCSQKQKAILSALVFSSMVAGYRCKGGDD